MLSAEHNLLQDGYQSSCPKPNLPQCFRQTMGSTPHRGKADTLAVSCFFLSKEFYFLFFLKLSLSFSQVALAVFFSSSTYKLPFLAMREKQFSFVFWHRQNFRFWITWRPILNRGEMDDGSCRWRLRSSGAIGQRAVLIWQYLLSNAEVVSSSLTWSMLFLTFCLS